MLVLACIDALLSAAICCHLLLSAANCWYLVLYTILQGFSQASQGSAGVDPRGFALSLPHSLDDSSACTLAEQIAICLALCVVIGLTKNVWARQYRTYVLVGTTSVILHVEVG